MTNIVILAQLISSISDAAEKLEKAKERNKIEEFNKIKQFILDLQGKIKQELER